MHFKNNEDDKALLTSLTSPNLAKQWVACSLVASTSLRATENNPYHFELEFELFELIEVELRQVQATREIPNLYRPIVGASDQQFIIAFPTVKNIVVLQLMPRRLIAFRIPQKY